jgi:hypothetical protein
VSSLRVGDGLVDIGGLDVVVRLGVASVTGGLRHRWPQTASDIGGHMWALVATTAHGI